jgi:hypothetical protein
VQVMASQRTSNGHYKTRFGTRPCKNSDNVDWNAVRSVKDFFARRSFAERSRAKTREAVPIPRKPSTRCRPKASWYWRNGTAPRAA